MRNGILNDSVTEDLSPKTFERIRRLAYDEAGIDLRSGKEQLVTSRLSKKVREAG